MLNLFTAVIIENFEKQQVGGARGADRLHIPDSGRADRTKAQLTSKIKLIVPPAPCPSPPLSTPQEQEAWRLNPQSLEEFVALWSEYDDGSGSIDARDLEALLLRLQPPLGLGPGAEGKDVLRFVFDLDIPLMAGRVPFHR
jgi:hypothetical protein